MLPLGFTGKRLYKGCHHLTSSLVTDCVTADQYYKIVGAWSDGDCNQGFEFDGAGKLTYTGQDGVYCLFNGVSDLSSSKVARVWYGLYINGVLASGAETPHDFQAANKIGGISITNFVKLQKYDYIEIYVKSEVAANPITHETLLLTLLGDM
ncbi:MAG: hypothetical protein KAU20_03480 [Nanoarchaeota archaeon]|nr:hypothetical protein [Nanoarchaeota archaeon]